MHPFENGSNDAFPFFATSSEAVLSRDTVRAVWGPRGMQRTFGEDEVGHFEILSRERP